MKTPNSSPNSKSKTIVITGCSSGFGLETTKALLDRGDRVIGILRGGQKRLDELLGQSPNASGFDADLSDPAQVERVSEQVLAKLRALDLEMDVLINNAGVGLMGTSEDQDPDELRKQFEVNFFSAVRLTQNFLPALRKAKGRIISLSSICGLASFPLYGAYCASKYALEAYMEALSHDLIQSGITVNLVEPGSFRTEFSGRNFWMGKRSRSPESLSYKVSQAFEGFVLKKRTLAPKPDWVVQTIVRLTEGKDSSLRSVVGWDARLLWLLKRILPQSVFF